MTDNTTTTESSTNSETELKDVATGGDTATVDLEDLAESLEAEAEDLRELREEAKEDEDVQWPPEEYRGMQRPVLEVEHSAELVRSDIERFGGSEFVIQKARAGEIARANDLVATDSLQSDQDARANIESSKHRLVQVCVQQVPPSTPTDAKGELQTTAFEPPTFNHLHQKVKNFNRYGKLELEDF
ncbi:hypothetical protein [Haloarcula pellucida]|uniref:Uncharacterized protein n=1 Tax=Haloarcula pellucida TaxID=1427151 RepID=A0A830GQZ7_9EURY|nr:hypothetical protein [Halomicroarcula pellucida]MBX0350470.1 hypothetical protein [Halomicroarcula pellucida]GGO03481.1 hypothetical protein GCM10009030_39160 [Halomicroarcula pellucida]